MKHGVIVGWERNSASLRLKRLASKKGKGNDAIHCGFLFEKACAFVSSGAGLSLIHISEPTRPY